jgi:hypothetical protein
MGELLPGGSPGIPGCEEGGRPMAGAPGGWPWRWDPPLICWGRLDSE